MPRGLDNDGEDSSAPLTLEETRPFDIGEVAVVDRVAIEGSAFEIGEKLGRYVLLRELGRGGMAVVYVAYDPELDRKVALKLVRPRRGSRGSADQERLLREAQALARLSHPNVVHVYDVGIYEAHVYIAMELVEGQTMRSWLQAAARSWREVLDVCTRAGRGLAAAHAAGLVHLDFKPSNVILGDDGRVRVVDFGLAREPRSLSRDSIVPPRMPESTSTTLETVTGSHRRLGEPLTEQGAVMGTPGYIAPEQLRGEQPDARADQFSFCVALWEGLFGRRPFVAGQGEKLDRIVLGGRVSEPPRDRRVPPWLRRIVERGLSVRPEDRFADMQALLATLARDPDRARRRMALIAAGAVTLAGGGWGLYQAADARVVRCTGGEEKLQELWSPSRRENARAAFVDTGLPFAEDVWRGTERAIDQYVQSWRRAHLDACEATHLRGEQSAELLDLRMHCLERARGDLNGLLTVFAEADEAVVRNAVDAVARLGPLERCTDLLALRAEGRPRDPVLREAVDAVDAELAHAKGFAHAGHARQALELASALLERAAALEVPALEMRVTETMASAYSTLGDEKNAEIYNSRALFLAERGGLDLERARLLIQLGYVVGYRAGDYARGKWYLALAREVLLRTGEQGVVLSELYSNEAVLEASHGRPDAALGLLRDAERIRRSIEGSDVSLAVVLSNMGGAHFEKGEYDQALAHYQEVHAIQSSVFGDKHPAICESFENLGNVLHAMGRSEEALDHHRRAAAICDAAGVGGGIAGAQRLNNQATVLLALERPGEAVELYRQALVLCETQSNHPARAVMLANLAEAMLAAGHGAEQALALYDESLTIIDATLGREQVFWAVARSGAGHALLELGRFGEAIVALEEAVTLFERVTADPQLLAEAEFHLARALVAESSDPQVRERARALVQRSLTTFTRTGDRGRTLAAASRRWLRTHPD